VENKRSLPAGGIQLMEISFWRQIHFNKKMDKRSLKGKSAQTNLIKRII
jgi:hypothetical protein